MATGKNKLLRYARVYFGGYNISGDARTIGTLQNKIDPIDMTALSDSYRNALGAGHREVGVMGFQAFLNDTASSGAHTLMKNGGSTQLSVLLGSLAEPAIGDIAYLLPAVLLSYPYSFDGGAAIISGDFMPDASQSLTASPFGIVQHPATSLSATTNATSVDNGASSANGAIAILHLVATSSGDFALKVQDSANNSDWSDLITFSSDGSAITSEVGTATGTVDRYTRFQATRTGGSCTPVVSFARL